MKRYISTSILILTLACLQAAADEGMWMIHAIDAAIEKKMKERGLELSAKEIYDADADGATISDAVVSMEFGCTGSMISGQGLLITNHHCAYGDVHRLSTPEHNYLEDGFWAMRSDEEVNIKGKSVWFLKKVIDVTDEVCELKRKHEAEGKPLGSRRLGHLMESRYAAQTGLDAWLASMWSGSKYYMALYEVYKDVRLVAAPPVSSAAFGGDIDNWEWPQHKCDFALYRVYTAPDGSPAEYSEDNIPMKPARTLPLSLDGYKEGDFTMVIGYPGRTNRYSSSFETMSSTSIRLPISNELRGRQMEIIRRWMESDPEIRLKYSDYYFGLSNVQELQSGEVLCCGRFDVAGRKAQTEKELQEWTDASKERSGTWGDLLERMEKAYGDVREGERNLVYLRETLVRGTRMTRIVGKIRRFVDGKPVEGLWKSLQKDYDAIDLRVERELYSYAVKTFLANVDRGMAGPFQKELIERYGGDFQAIADYTWDNSLLTDTTRLHRFIEEGRSPEDCRTDPLLRFLNDVHVFDYNRKIQEAEGENSRLILDREFTHALYQMRLDRKEPQYPDANSTMRITYGSVGPLEPYDGILCDWKSTARGILEKYDPSSYEFSLSDRQYLLYRKGDWGRWGVPDGKGKTEMYVNFITDNDITGGNSGSPVLNARGELIGLAFDGNKESLAGNMMWVEGYNKCVCVDIRFVLWTLDHYAGMTRIIEELGL